MNIPEFPVNPQKHRKGWSRLCHAASYSWQGLRAAWQESALRLEFILAAFMIPAAFGLGRSPIEVALLMGSVLFVIIVELLNTAIELTLDRVSGDWHALTKKAKDMGSAAVMLACLACGGLWLAVLMSRWA